MELKERLKKRILEIPINDRAFREKHRFANNLGVEVKELEPLLDELRDKDILKEKIEYMCPTCRDTYVLDKELLAEMMEEEGVLGCEECGDTIDTVRNRTGYVFYDIKNREALINW